MLPIVETAPFKLHQRRPGFWILLARLQGLLRNRLSRLEPEQLPPHLQRDLGFSDYAARGRSDLPPMAPRDFWLR
jgi:hypothetical protein